MGEVMLDRSECLKALKNMNNGKSPGMLQRPFLYQYLKV
jgi:hypothetical protein